MQYSTVSVPARSEVASAMSAETRRFLAATHPRLCCPRCESDVVVRGSAIACTSCRHTYAVVDDIPLLFWPNEPDAFSEDVTEIVKAFYEETPFPNYDEFDSVASLVEKARSGIYARLLDEQIPFNARILECGCGTGQLSNFLSIANRTVVGTDICLNSLRLGQAFKAQNDLRSVHFLQMNLFRPVFRPESFDVVISNGVLHHTSDPRRGFVTIGRLVRPGGYLVVGLYHRYGRLLTNTRRLIFRLFGSRLAFLDPNLRDHSRSAAKQRAWFRDQYQHPHESRHTIGEVLRWLADSGFSLVKTIPKTRPPFERFSEAERLFEPDRVGNTLERWEAELSTIFSGSREGGFFIVIGRKT